ncbi:MAG: phosphatidylserine decarboxylase [Thermodesulfobacteria bacterium]|nr:phosphatidylserine decarboxylase [Thermodesulfobacteriota bacterium]
MIVKEGLPYVLGPGTLGAVIGHLTKKKPLLYAGLGLSAAMAFFFRDPDRYPPFDRELILAPADGRIVTIRREKEDRFLETEVYRIGIFMSLFDVHVNRSPVTGRVLDIVHEPGKFLPANKDEAYRENEKRYYLIERLDGVPILVVQIAGLIARRTVPFVRKGDEVLACERLGMIRFGSRVEVLVPAENVRLLVNMGHRVRAGECPLALLPWKKNG